VAFVCSLAVLSGRLRKSVEINFQTNSIAASNIKATSVFFLKKQEKQNKNKKRHSIYTHVHVVTVGQRFTVVHGCNNRLQQKAAEKCKSFVVYFCSFAVLCSPLWALWSFAVLGGPCGPLWFFAVFSQTPPRNPVKRSECVIDPISPAARSIASGPPELFVRQPD